MEGYVLHFYVHENRQHKGQPTWQWLMRQANRMGLQGGSAFRTISGFGRHQVLHEEHFFDVVGTTTIELQFLVLPADRERLMALIATEGLELFYIETPARFGKTAGP
ncbi:MAG TPA: DUF190 domain-containing protein [Steroidobacteraceae bacterium]|nr:DUF190 domain-containing protein [Steroidobacteraceae bacterium]